MKTLEQRDDVAELRSELEAVRRELAELRASVAEQVTTRRLVVVDEQGREVIYTAVTESAVQLVVTHHDDDDDIARSFKYENQPEVQLQASHEGQGCEAGWNISIDGDIIAGVFGYGVDGISYGGRTREVTSSLHLVRAECDAATRSGRTSSERSVGVDPTRGIEIRTAPMSARPRFEIVTT